MPANAWCFPSCCSCIATARCPLRRCVPLRLPAAAAASHRCRVSLPTAVQELPITQVLRPLVSVQHPGEGASKWNNHPLTRLAVAAALAGLLSVLYRHSPDKGMRGRALQGSLQHPVCLPGVCLRCHGGCRQRSNGTGHSRQAAGRHTPCWVFSSCPWPPPLPGLAALAPLPQPDMEAAAEWGRWC